MGYQHIFEYLVCDLSFDQLRSKDYDLQDLMKTSVWHLTTAKMDQKLLLAEEEDEESEIFFKPYMLGARCWVQFKDEERALVFYARKAKATAIQPIVVFRKIATIAVKAEIVVTDEDGFFDVQFKYAFTDCLLHCLRSVPRNMSWLAMQNLLKEELDWSCNSRFLMPDFPAMTTRSNFFKSILGDAERAPLLRKRPASGADVVARLQREHR